MIHRDQNRGTGRTYRMLQQAVEAAAWGKTVHVVAANQNCADLMLRDVLRISHGQYEAKYLCGRPPTIQIESAGQIRFLTAGALLEGMSGPILVDHAVQEKRLIDWDYIERVRAINQPYETQFQREYLCTWPDPEPPPLDSRGEPTKRRQH